MERYKNKFHFNGLLLAIVMMMAMSHVCRANPSGIEADNSTGNNYSHDGVQSDCSIWQSCGECASRTPCSWQLDKQRCNDTRRLEHDSLSLAVTNSTQCPWLKPVQNWASGASVKYKYRVRIGNDPNGVFAAFLRGLHDRLHFCLAQCKYKNNVTDDGSEIESGLLNKPASMFVDQQAKSITYLFHVRIDENVQLRFDDENDYFFTVYERGKECSDEERINEDCAECAWTADGLRQYAKWCAPGNACTGARTTFIQRGADDFHFTANAPNVVVPGRCNDVRVLSVRPLSAPSSVAGTVVSVVVRNHWILAASGNRTVVVTVAGRPCELPVTVDKETITCTTTTTSTPTPVSGPVEVAYVSPSSNTTTFRFRSAETFRFVDPELTSVSPSCGPVSGGTLLSVSGRHLDVGTAVQVSVGDNVTCAVVGVRRPDVITCVTGPSSGPTDTAPVRVQFDALSVYPRYSDASVTGLRFEYTVDPVLAPGQRFESIASGGTAVPVRDGRFFCVQSALLYVVHAGVRYFGPCHLRNSSYMACTSPRLNVSAVTSDSDAVPIPLHFGFQMSFNDHVFDMLPQPDLPGFHVYADPEFSDFDTQNDTMVTINGRHLDRGYSSAADLTIQSGNSTVVPGDCIVTQVQWDRIQCEFTSLSDLASLDSMVVIIGEWFNHTVPRKKRVYSNRLTKKGYVVISISVVVIIVGGLLLFKLFSKRVRRSIGRSIVKSRDMPAVSTQTIIFSKMITNRNL